MAFCAQLFFPHFRIACNIYNILHVFYINVISINIIRSLINVLPSLTFYVTLRFSMVRHVPHYVSYATMHMVRSLIRSRVLRYSSIQHNFLMTFASAKQSRGYSSAKFGGHNQIAREDKYLRSLRKYVYR